MNGLSFLRLKSTTDDLASLVTAFNEINGFFSRNILASKALALGYLATPKAEALDSQLTSPPILLYALL